jgi:hypothetical protein
MEKKAATKEIQGLFLRHSKLFLPWVFSYCKLSEEWIDSNEARIDWVALSKNESMIWSEKLVLKYANRWQMEFISKNEALPWSIDLIKAIARPIDRNALSANEGLPWDFNFINTFKDKWNWYALIQNPSVSWTQEMLITFNQMDKNLSKVNGTALWTDDFIKKYGSKINWSFLTYNENIEWNEELIKKFENYFKPFERKTTPHTVSPWKGISSNRNVPWSIDFIERYREKFVFRKYGLEWQELSTNPHLPWHDNSLLSRYEKHWNWNKIGLNEGVKWTEETFETYKERLPWIANSLSIQSISRTKNLPWSNDFITKYRNNWQWWFLSHNEGIEWNESLIEKFRNDIVLSQLLTNRSAPWSLEFILKHEHEIADAWAFASEEFKAFIWNLIFEPVVNEAFLENLFTSLSNPYRYRSTMEQKNFSNNQKMLLELGDEIGHMDFVKHPTQYPNVAIETFKDCLQQFLYTIALAPENELHINFEALAAGYERIEKSERGRCMTLMREIYWQLGEIIEETQGFYDFHRQVYLKHYQQNKQFMLALKNGIHLNQNMDYYKKYIDSFGLRTLEIISLMVSLEQFNVIKSNPFIPSHNAPF